MESLQSAAYAALMCPDPSEKCQQVAALAARLEDGQFDLTRRAAPLSIDEPGRPSRPKLVPPQDVPRRRLGSPRGRVALVHAVAHIEFNAINLALDAVYRFDGMPDEYYCDWVSVSADEARHFGLLEQRLRDMNANYGDCEAHNGLWEMAVATSDSCLSRMALVPRVLEARGLDVTPGMIERVTRAGDLATVSVLEVILDEEVGHVEIGTRWFNYCCEIQNQDPEAVFEELMNQHGRGRVKPPFNYAARREAGFSERDMVMLEALGASRDE